GEVHKAAVMLQPITRLVQHLALHTQCVTGKHRPRPAQIVETRRTETRQRLPALAGEQLQRQCSRVPAGGGECTEGCVTRVGIAQMKGLWIITLGEASDGRCRYRGRTMRLVQIRFEILIMDHDIAPTGVGRRLNMMCEVMSMTVASCRSTTSKRACTRPISGRLPDGRRSSTVLRTASRSPGCTGRIQRRDSTPGEPMHAALLSTLSTSMRMHQPVICRPSASAVPSPSCVHAPGPV